jgi:hypothetical protein
VELVRKKLEVERVRQVVEIRSTLRYFSASRLVTCGLLEVKAGGPCVNTAGHFEHSVDSRRHTRVTGWYWLRQRRKDRQGSWGMSQKGIRQCSERRWVRCVHVQIEAVDKRCQMIIVGCLREDEKVEVCGQV